jgi:hypothetical protein
MVDSSAIITDDEDDSTIMQGHISFFNGPQQAGISK